MAQTNWTIRQLERHSVTEIVTKVHWKVEYVDGAFSAAAQDVVCICEDMSSVDTNSSEFTQFKNLTETQLIEWVKTAIGEEDLTKIIEDLAYNVDKQKNFANNFVYGLPWESVESEDTPTE